MDMGERIKKLRKELNLTQTEFAERLGSVQNTITRYETGNRTPSSSVITLICHEFNVSESWLRTGEGEMFVPLTRSQEIAEFVGKILKGDEDNFKRRFVAILAELDEAEWELIEKMAVKLAAGETKKD